MALGSLVDSPLQQNPLAGGNDLMAGGGGFETSFNLLQRPDENIERQYFYNKDLNKLFNMQMGVRMAAPKGFESVTKNQYEDFASKGATLQKASMFNDAMGGGYNLDLPRLTSGPNSGQVDRNSPEFLYYYGDSQQQKLPPKLSLESKIFTQEDGLPGNDSNIPLNNFPGNPNRKPADPANLGSAGGPSLFPNKIGGIENTAIASLPDNNYTRSVQPIVSGPETFEIATQQAPMNPFNRVGQQLTGPNQDDILGTLKNIEQGIASLGQGGMNQSSFGGFNNNFGIGSFFPPYGGMYGK